jgi:hypothetical protein
MSVSLAIINSTEKSSILVSFSHLQKKVMLSTRRRYLLRFYEKIKIIILLQYKVRIHMNKTSLAITVLAIVAATAMGLYGFVATQSAAAQFDTTNDGSQTGTQTGTSTGGNGGAGGISVFGGSADGGAGGEASVGQSILQQLGQTGAFGTSSNNPP